MRFVFVSLVLFLCGPLFAMASEVSGTVEVQLKGDQKKDDLSGVVVYLDQIQDAAIPAAVLKKEYSMETRNKQLSPRILAVPVGAKINFPNYDPIFHNLFSVSRPNEFDLGLYKGGTTKTKSFSVAGVVRVYCNVHPQMSATIIVAKSPYYVSADRAGSFSLGQIPDGAYTIHAYTEEGQTEQRIEVGANPLKVMLTIDARGYKKIKHKNKFGKDYPTEGNEQY